MLCGRVGVTGTGYSVIRPVGVIRAILCPGDSVDQRLPSGPSVMSSGPVRGVARWKVVVRAAAAVDPAGAAPALCTRARSAAATTVVAATTARTRFGTLIGPLWRG